MSVEDLLGEVDRLERELVKFTADLVRVPTVNPPGEVAECAEILRSKVESIGMRTELVEPKKDRVNVLAELQGEGKGPLLLFNGHTDVVPEGDVELWSVDPFAGEVKDGWLYGRGSSDMKGALASIGIAIEAVVNSGMELEGSVVFHGVADEEVGGRYGTQYLAKEDLIKADMGVVAEASVFDGVVAVRPAVRGISWLSLETYGKAGHASDPSRGVNAVLSMSRLLLALEELDLDLGHHRYLPDPSMSPGTVIRGGVKTNIIPERCRADVDARTIPSVSPEMILSKVQGVIDRMSSEDPTFRASAEILSAANKAAEIPEDHRVIREAVEATNTVLGYEPVMRGGSGSNDASYIIHDAGVPVICGFGPGDAVLGNAHGPDEKVRVEELLDFAKIYALMISRICA